MKTRQEKVKEILDMGLYIWSIGGAGSVTHRAIGERLGRNPAGVLYYFDYKMTDLRNQIAEYAIETDYKTVIIQLIVSNHPAIEKLTEARRAEYLSFVK